MSSFLRFLLINSLLFMPKITSIGWKKFEKFLLFVGYVFKRQRGDRRVYWRTNLKRPVIFCQHIKNCLSLLFEIIYEYSGLIIMNI